MITQHRVRLLVVLSVVLSIAQLAKADGVDFAGFSGGKVTFTPAVGQSLQVSGAPINLLWLLSEAGTKYIVDSGALNFKTGTASSIDPNNNMVMFGAGSSPTDLTITGNVFNGSTQIASGNLLSGTFLSGNGQFGNGIGFLGGLFNITSINSDLMLAIFGSAPQNQMDGTIGQVLFNMSLNSNGTYEGSIGSTNLIANIAEPQTLLLLGSGLLIASGFLRRKLEKRQVA